MANLDKIVNILTLFYKKERKTRKIKEIKQNAEIKKDLQNCFRRSFYF